MKTFKRNPENALFLRQEELLVKEVKKHPCLYNKADNSYKAHDVIRNTWESMSFTLEFNDNAIFKYYLFY